MSQTASFREAAAAAADSLRSSKLRSFLTLLGIVLATTTLIVVMSLIHGMDSYIANEVSNMGSDGFRVVKIAFLGNFDPKKYLLMQKRNPELSPDEYQYLKDHATLVRDFGMSALYASARAQVPPVPPARSGGPAGNLTEPAVPRTAGLGDCRFPQRRR